jgi:hypothetical protein
MEMRALGRIWMGAVWALLRTGGLLWADSQRVVGLLLAYWKYYGGDRGNKYGLPAL